MLALALTLGFPAVPTAPQDGLEESIATYLAAWESRGELSGVVLAARGDEVVFRRAYGLADVEREIRNTPETRFHVASVTKTFTAAALLLLEDTGALSLADPLARFLPDYPRGDEITLEHLLSHSSGIPDHHDLPGFEERTADGIKLAELVEWQSGFPLEYDPGTHNRYVNSGYAVLARVVELVGGESFPDFVRTNLLEPLGIHATGEVDAQYAGARGYVYGPPPTHRIAVPARDYAYAMGSGSLASTADDLLAWLRAVDAKTLVDAQRTYWPFGWGKELYGTHEALEQTGMHSGFTATISVVPAIDLYVVHLSNLQAGLPFQRVHRDVVRLCLGGAVTPPAPIAATAWNPAHGELYAGRYDAGDRNRPTLSANPDGLWWSWDPRQAPQYLEPIGPRRFRLVVDGSELAFAPRAEGEETSFELLAPWNAEGAAPVYVRVR